MKKQATKKLTKKDIAKPSGAKVVTVRLGSLEGPLNKHCEKHGMKASAVIREALAKHLNKPAPKMNGALANLQQFQKPARKKRKTKK